MAVLHHLRTDRRASLGARTTIGRSRACTLRLDARRASGEHAAMVWSPDGWRVRDLGSSNGTWLDGRRLVAGQAAPVVEGAALAFGETDDRWVLVDARSPTPFARRASTADEVTAEGGVLGLPSADDPELMIFRRGADWIAEGRDGHRPVHDQDLLTVGGVPWRVYLPTMLAATVMDDGAREPALGGLRLRLNISRDHEFVGVELLRGAEVVDVPPRTMHYMLVVLARARVRPMQPPGDADAAWVPIEDVARALGVDYRTVGVYVCRLRQQLGGLGVDDAAALVERRPGAIRLGPVAVELDGG